MVKLKFCPKCKGENIVGVRGDNLLWRCVGCGLEMPTFPERDANKKPSKLNRS